jgi:hypothetical protein
MPKMKQPFQPKQRIKRPAPEPPEGWPRTLAPADLEALAPRPADLARLPALPEPNSPADLARLSVAGTSGDE